MAKFRVKKAGVVGFIALLLTAVYHSCSAPAGMFCQEQRECSTGLTCNKPAGAGPSSYGVCVPALRGAGETCLHSADCQTGLRCSNELGVFNGDERHGLCQVDTSPPVDAGAKDLAATPMFDQRPPTDLTPQSDL